jgi:seryl-tRNA(Sec) selenium transferase
MQGMDSYTQAATERAMKVQEVMLQAMSKKITWWQAADQSSRLRTHELSAQIVR